MQSTAIALLVPAFAMAQGVPAIPKQQGDTIPTLKLGPDPKVGHGTVAAIHGTVGPNGLRLAVGELSILQPVMVMLLAHDEAEDLTLSLFKKDWTSVRRTASTRGSGIARFEFRTQGGVNILLRGASAETPFALVVWAGEELRPSMPDVLVTYDEFRAHNPKATVSLAGGPAAAGSGGTSFGLWIAAATLFVGAGGFFAWRILGRRNEA